MDWFKGSIPEAILASKERNGIFVVFICDKSDSSKVAKESLNSEKISSILMSGKFVCIQLENGSQEAKQFAQIYPLIVVPSLFLIKGQTGIPLEVIGGNFSEKSLLEKLQPLVESPEKKPEVSANQPSEGTSSSEGAVAVDVPTENAEASPSSDARNDETPLPSTSSVDVSESKPQEVPKGEEETVVSSSQEADLAKKIERAKMLLEERQIEKENEKRETEKQKEMERRRQGQGMALAKQKREEEELKELALQRKKEKQEDRIHRERVKAQIAADRLERERREALFKSPPPDAPAAEPAQPQQPAQANNSSNARIKFRFPDSSSINGHFSRDDTLAVVRDYVRENATMHLSHFTLVSILHHRPFTDDQMGSTLAELGLTPSATINVKPSSGGDKTVLPSGGSFYDTFWTLFSPIIFILNYIKRLLGVGAPSASSEGASSAPQEDDASGSSSKRLKTEGSYSTRNRPRTAYGSRREGNIHRLNRGNEGDEDDENNTWNGNSTQQM